MRKPKHLRSCSLISIQFLPLSCIMTPCRTEKVDFSKKIIIKKQNHQKNRSTGRITRRNKKTRKKITKIKNKQKKQKKAKPAFSAVFFVFLVFFLGFGFLVCFFWLLCFFCFFYIFSVKPYILCVVGLITLATQDFPSLI